MRGVGCPQFGFPRLRRIGGTIIGLAIATHDTPSADTNALPEQQSLATSEKIMDDALLDEC